MRYTEKTEVTKDEYLRLVGLLTLASGYNEKLKDILRCVIRITGETDDYGHSGDAVYLDYSADELLEKLGIKVSE